MVYVTSGIDNNQQDTRIYYAATGFREAALAWWQTHLGVNNNAHGQQDWTAFRNLVITRFQPANFQTHLRRQLRSLKQTHSVTDYTTKFLNLID